MDFIALLLQAYSTENGGDLVNNLVMFFIAWMLVKKEINKQFQKLTDEISGIKTVVSDLADNINKVENSHLGRIAQLEADVQILESKNP